MAATDGRELCLAFLGSVGDGLRWLLPMADEIDRKYQLLSFVSYQSTADYGAFSQDQIARCDVLICHPLDNAPFSDRARYANFLRQFPAATRKILVPWPRFDALWPFHVTHDICLPLPLYQPFWPHYKADPPAAEPGRAASVRGDAATYPFGDSYVVGKLHEGVPPAEIVSAYLNLDVASLVDLDLRAEQALAALEQDERSAEVKIAAIAARFRESKLFVAPEFAANCLLLQIANEVLALLALPPLPEGLLAQIQPLIKSEMPIHPSVGRFFGISYANPETRYLVDRHRLLTFAEYLRGYVEQLAAERHPTAAAAAEIRGFAFD